MHSSELLFQIEQRLSRRPGTSCTARRQRTNKALLPGIRRTRQVFTRWHEAAGKHRMAPLLPTLRRKGSTSVRKSHAVTASVHCLIWRFRGVPMFCPRTAIATADQRRLTPTDNRGCQLQRHHTPTRILPEPGLPFVSIEGDLTLLYLLGRFCRRMAPLVMLRRATSGLAAAPGRFNAGGW
jgi:hypothetical protein